MKVITYAHANRESMLKVGTEAGLTGEALQLFAHALGEVEIRLEVAETGKAEIVEVNGVELKTPTHS